MWPLPRRKTVVVETRKRLTNSSASPKPNSHLGLVKCQERCGREKFAPGELPCLRVRGSTGLISQRTLSLATHRTTGKASAYNE